MSPFTTHQASFPFEWRCASCRFTQWVRVKAKGSGTSLLARADDSVASSIATMNAQQNAWRGAKMKLAQRPCPKCGAVDRRTIVLTVVRAFFVSTFSAALPLGYVFLQMQLPPFTAWALPATSVACGLGITAFLWFFRWQAAGRDIVPDDQA